MRMPQPAAISIDVGIDMHYQYRICTHVSVTLFIDGVNTATGKYKARARRKGCLVK
jgi:hypothetical protein